MYHSNGKSPDKAAVLILRLFSSYKSHLTSIMLPILCFKMFY